MFKPGDEVVCIQMDCAPEMAGQIFVVEIFAQAGEIPTGAWCALDGPGVQLVGVHTDDGPHNGMWGWDATRFRKVQRKNSRLTLESFFTVPGGFEEPKRAPSKKKTNA